MTKAKKPELARELSELREMYAESEKRRAAMEQRLKVLEEAEAERQRIAKEREERERRHNSGISVGRYGGYKSPTGKKFATDVNYKAALLKMEVGGSPLDDIIGIGSSPGGYLREEYHFAVNAKAVYLVEDTITLLPEHVRHFADVLLPDIKSAKIPEIFTEGRSEVSGLLVFVNRRKKENDNGKMEDPVQLALDKGLLVMQSTGKNKLTPITDASQVTDPQREA